jgi:hypothetical protein
MWWRVQVMELLVTQFSPTSCHFISLSFNIFFITLFSWNIFQIYCSQIYYIITFEITSSAVSKMSWSNAETIKYTAEKSTDFSSVNSLTSLTSLEQNWNYVMTVTLMASEVDSPEMDKNSNNLFVLYWSTNRGGRIAIPAGCSESKAK